MDLVTLNWTDLNFQYNVRDNKFKWISYTFDTSNEKNSGKRVIDLPSFKVLEGIMDRAYSGNGFSKEDAGEITHSRRSVGYNYGNSSLWSLFRRGMVYGQLRADTGSQTIELSHHDRSQGRLLSALNQIRMLPSRNLNPASHTAITSTPDVSEALGEIDALIYENESLISFLP